MDSQNILTTNGGGGVSALLDYPRGGQAWRYTQSKIMQFDFLKDFIFGSTASAYLVCNVCNYLYFYTIAYENYAVRPNYRLEGGGMNRCLCGI